MKTENFGTKVSQTGFFFVFYSVCKTNRQIFVWMQFVYLWMAEGTFDFDLGWKQRLSLATILDKISYTFNWNPYLRNQGRARARHQPRGSIMCQRQCRPSSRISTTLQSQRGVTVTQSSPSRRWRGWCSASGPYGRRRQPSTSYELRKIRDNIPMFRLREITRCE